MADYIKRIRTEAGDLQIDYESLANLPVSDATLTQSGKFADAKAVGDRISGMSSPVTSVNSKTGAVTLSASDVGALPDTYTAPVTSVNSKTGAVSITTITGNAGTATKLATARTVRTNLGSTSTASFDGSANITPGVTGTLPVANGGTGATDAATARSNLGAAASSHTHSNYVAKTAFSLSGTNLTITIS